MPDYQKGKIYKIISNETDEVYIGSTTQTLSLRLGGHKRNYKKYLNNKYSYTTSYNILKYDDVKIILIEECPCDNREQLLKREQYYIDNMDCINKNRATISHLTKEENGKYKYQQALKNNPNLCKDIYQNALKNNPNLCKDRYKRRLEKNPNLSKDEYQSRLEKNPNLNKDEYQKALKNNPNINKEKYQKYKDTKNQKILCVCGREVYKRYLNKHKTLKIHNDLLSKKIIT